MTNDAQRTKARDYQLRRRLRSGLPLIECLICHGKFRAMGSHLVKVHDTDHRAYKRIYSLEPLAAIDLRDAQRVLVAEKGLTAYLTTPDAVVNHVKAMSKAEKHARTNETRNSVTAIDRKIERLLALKNSRS